MMPGYFPALIGFTAAVFRQYPGRIQEWYELLRCPRGDYMRDGSHPDGNLWLALFLSETEEALQVLGAATRELEDRHEHNLTQGTSNTASADQVDAGFQALMESLEPHRTSWLDACLRSTGEFVATGDPQVIIFVCRQLNAHLDDPDPDVRTETQYFATLVLTALAGIAGDSARIVLKQAVEHEEDLGDDIRAMMLEIAQETPEKLQQRMEQLRTVALGQQPPS
jgi:hypothetical protein